MISQDNDKNISCDECGAVVTLPKNAFKVRNPDRNAQRLGLIQEERQKQDHKKEQAQIAQENARRFYLTPHYNVYINQTRYDADGVIVDQSGAWAACLKRHHHGESYIYRNDRGPIPAPSGWQEKATEMS